MSPYTARPHNTEQHLPGPECDLFLRMWSTNLGGGDNQTEKNKRRLLVEHMSIRDVKDRTISQLLSMAMNMLFMMVRHAQKVKGEA